MTEPTAAEEGPTKNQLAKSISYAIKEKLGHNSSWNLSVAFPPEDKKDDVVWGSFVNPVKEKLVFELEVERGTVVQQLTSNNRKCLQRPSKTCCVVIGYVALICTLVGVFAMYEGKYSPKPG